MSKPVHLIIGGGGDTGQAVTQLLRERGEPVVWAGRPSDHLEDACRRLDVPVFHLDATQPEQIEEVAARAAKDSGLASIVNLVGSIVLKAAHLTSVEEFEATLRTNLFSAFGTVKAAAKHSGISPEFTKSISIA